MRRRATKVPALDDPPPATLEPGPVAEAVVLELALLFCVKLELEEVGVVVLDVDTRVVELVEQEPEADDPPVAKNPQLDFAQFLLILITTGLAGRLRLANPTVPRPPDRVAASASELTSATQPMAAATMPTVTLFMTILRASSTPSALLRGHPRDKPRFR